MLSVDFTSFNEELIIFVLSVAVGPEKVVKSLLDSSERQLKCLESLNVESENFKLHFDCSVSILTNCFHILYYINTHSVDLFKEDNLHLLDNELESIDERYKAILTHFEKLGVK